MRYEGNIFRPPSESGSLLIQATIGCPHNKCTFCNLYKNTRFRVRPIQDIKEDLQSARDYYGQYVETIFFPDGNTIIMKTNQLCEIFEFAHQLFPDLQRITIYGSARFVNKKTEAELIKLHQAGLSRVHMGMESGDDVILQKVCKGTSAAEIIAAGSKLKAAGIQVSEYYIIGLGGWSRWREHAENSARVLSAFSPEFIRLRTLALEPSMPIWAEIQSGEFVYLSPHQSLQELRVLIANLDCQNSLVLSDHVSNYININGLIPRDRERMVGDIDRALQIDESLFRVPDLHHF
jgi:radical SAM superfamily enzyme YgiQ (UPF0313 family)